MAPGPFSGQRAPARLSARAPARPPPLAPAPARAARAGAGRWRRYCCRPRGASAPPVARGPGGGRGQPLAGSRSPPLRSHASRKVCPLALRRPAPGAPPRRGERWGGGREGTPAEECAGPGGGVPGSRCPTRRGPAAREGWDHVVFVLRRRREVPGPGQPSFGWTGSRDPRGHPERLGRGLLENCWAVEVQVARGPMSVRSAQSQPRGPPSTRLHS